jgi:peptidoglycan/LPS O-acetylase OafA/YrhL
MKRANNFDIIRLYLSVVVVFFHIGAISDAPIFSSLTRFFSGHLAVEGFFAISGFLIFASYERCTSLTDYLSKRASRILPGYWLATALCLTIALSGGHFHVGRFLLANLSFGNFLAPGIPGVFMNNHMPIMNGALWTIKIEVMFYLIVPIIVWLCRRLNRDAVLWSIFVASVAFRIAFASHETLSEQLPGQLSFFMIGALIHYHLPFFEKHGTWITIATAVMYLAHTATGWFILRPAAVATLTLCASLLFPVVKGPTRWGDFSYGTYVLHWPIIQVVAAAGLYRANPWLAMAVTIIALTICVPLSWYFVEKPSLALAHSRRIKTRDPAIIPS